MLLPFHLNVLKPGAPALLHDNPYSQDSLLERNENYISKHGVEIPNFFIFIWNLKTEKSLSRLSDLKHLEWIKKPVPHTKNQKERKKQCLHKGMLGVGKVTRHFQILNSKTKIDVTVVLTQARKIPFEYV